MFPDWPSTGWTHRGVRTPYSSTWLCLDCDSTGERTGVTSLIIPYNQMSREGCRESAALVHQPVSRGWAAVQTGVKCSMERGK